MTFNPLNGAKSALSQNKTHSLWYGFKVTLVLTGLILGISLNVRGGEQTTSEGALPPLFTTCDIVLGNVLVSTVAAARTEATSPSHFYTKVETPLKDLLNSRSAAEDFRRISYDPIAYTYLVAWLRQEQLLSDDEYVQLAAIFPNQTLKGRDHADFMLPDDFTNKLRRYWSFDDEISDISIDELIAKVERLYKNKLKALTDKKSKPWTITATEVTERNLQSGQIILSAFKKLKLEESKTRGALIGLITSLSDVSRRQGLSDTEKKAHMASIVKRYRHHHLASKYTPFELMMYWLVGLPVKTVTAQLIDPQEVVEFISRNRVTDWLRQRLGLRRRLWTNGQTKIEVPIREIALKLRLLPGGDGFLRWVEDPNGDSTSQLDRIRELQSQVEQSVRENQPRWAEGLKASVESLSHHYPVIQSALDNQSSDLPKTDGFMGNQLSLFYHVWFQYQTLMHLVTHPLNKSQMTGLTDAEKHGRGLLNDYFTYQADGSKKKSINYSRLDQTVLHVLLRMLGGVPMKQVTDDLNFPMPSQIGPKINARLVAAATNFSNVGVWSLNTHPFDLFMRVFRSGSRLDPMSWLLGEEPYLGLGEEFSLFLPDQESRQLVAILTLLIELANAEEKNSAELKESAWANFTCLVNSLEAGNWVEANYQLIKPTIDDLKFNDNHVKKALDSDVQSGKSILVQIRMARMLNLKSADGWTANEIAQLYNGLKKQDQEALTFLLVDQRVRLTYGRRFGQETKNFVNDQFDGSLTSSAPNLNFMRKAQFNLYSSLLAELGRQYQNKIGVLDQISLLRDEYPVALPLSLGEMEKALKQFGSDLDLTELDLTLEEWVQNLTIQLSVNPHLGVSAHLEAH